MPLCPSQIPHALAWYATTSFAVADRPEPWAELASLSWGLPVY
jgi:hypothetical protein